MSEPEGPIESFQDMFLALGDMECLDSAICRAEELVLSATTGKLQQRHQSLLAGLLGTRNSLRAKVDRLHEADGRGSQETEICAGPQRETPNHPSEPCEGSSEWSGTEQLVDHDENIHIASENDNMDSEVTRGGEPIALPSSNEKVKSQSIMTDELRVGNALSLGVEHLKRLRMQMEFPLGDTLISDSVNYSPSINPFESRGPTEDLPKTAESLQTFQDMVKILDEITCQDNRRARKLGSGNGGIQLSPGKVPGVGNAESDERGMLGFAYNSDCLNNELGPLYSEFQSKATNQESMDQIMNFLKLYMTRKDIDCINDVIELAGDLALRNKGIQPLLGYMLEIRNAKLAGPDFVWLEKDYHPQTDTGVDSHLPEVRLCQVLEPSKSDEEIEELLENSNEMFKETGEIGYLDRAIEMAEKLVVSDLRNKEILDSHFPQICTPEGIGRMREAENPEMVVQSTKEAITAESQNSYNRARLFNNLSALFWKRYELLEAMEDLNYAIKYSEQGISIMHHNVPHAKMSSNLSIMFKEKFRVLRDHKDLDQAITLAKESVMAAPSEGNARAKIFSNMSTVLFARYRHLGDMDDLEQAIEWASKAVAATPEEGSDFNRAEMDQDLSAMLFSRYNSSGNVEDLEMAIRKVEEIIAAIPSHQLHQARIFSRLGRMLLARYDCYEALEDLEQGIKLAEGAVAVTLTSNLIRVEAVENLGLLLQRRHDLFGAMEDLERAINLIREEIVATSPFQPNQAGMSSTLGGILLARCDSLGDVEDLDEAINWTQKAANITPPGDPARACMSNRISTALHSRYKRLGDDDDLENAVRWAEEAVTTTPFSSPNRAGVARDLAEIFETRYERLGALEDLEQAIKCALEAISVTPAHDSKRPWLLSSLSTKLWLRSRRLETHESLEQAILYAEEAVRVAPSNHFDRPVILGRLGTVLMARYNFLRIPEDLERAICYAEEAVTKLPSNISCEKGITKDFGAMLLARYERFGDPKDLGRAMGHIGAAVAEMPSDHPDRANLLIDQAVAVEHRYRQTGSGRDFCQILHILYGAWYCQMSPSNSRIKAARKVAKLLIAKRRWQDACSILENAVKMLPMLNSRSLMRGDQEHLLSDFTQFAAETVSVAFQAGEDAAHCLRLLELGRGVIMGLVIDRRSDLSELRCIYPDISERYHRLRTQLDFPVVRIEEGDCGSTYQNGHRWRDRAAGELEELLTVIRELPSFEGFQLPPHSDKLMAMAIEGPIAILNSTELRSDAIIVTGSGIKSIALPRLRHTTVKERLGQISKLTRGSFRTFPSRNHKLGELLLWLWDVAVEPVLRALQLEAVKGDLPRIWWIGVGPLSMAPFHAAGDHTPGSTRNTISRVISSYIPTIKALSYAREKKLELLKRSDSRLLLVDMPTTPAHKPLPNVLQEVEEIIDIVKGKAVVDRLNHPSAAEVLTRLPSCHAIHFACHGVSDPQNPSNSHLLLCKEGVIDKLSVEAISTTNITRAEIAFLSACSTAENSSDKLSDESIYIASGFQLAGFSHVLATQWISTDIACREVACDFYSSLFNEDFRVGGDDRGHRKVSAALHYAVKRLRDKNFRKPTLWAPFIHTGA